MLEKPLGGRGILLGGVPGVAAATVMVIGGGVVGMNAAFIAIGMEADVFVFDRSIDRLRELDIALRRARLDGLLVDARDRGDAAARRPRDRRRARPRRARAARDHARAARADEAQRRARRRVDRPGRLLRDLAPDDALRPDLRGRRDHPLLRHEHAGRGADHLDLRAHQRDAAVRARARRPRRRARRSRATRACAAASTCAAGEITHPAVAEALGEPVTRHVEPTSLGARRPPEPEKESNDMATHDRRPAQQLHRRRARRRRRRRRPSRCSTRRPARRSRTAPLSERRGRRRAPCAPRGGVRRLVADHARRARRRRCCGSPTRSRSTARRSRDLEALNAGKPIEAVHDDEMPVMADNLRFFAGAARCLEGRAAGEYMEGYTSIHPPRGGRRDRPDHALELPADDGDLEDRPGARGRQHGRAEAGRDDADHDAARSPSSPPSILPRGRAQRGLRPRRARPAQALVNHPDVDMVSLTGSVDTGKRIARDRRGHAQARAPRARRQGAGGRLRRRRPGERAGDDRRHRLLQRRPGLHGGDARARRRQASTTTSSRASPSRRRGS